MVDEPYTTLAFYNDLKLPIGSYLKAFVAVKSESSKYAVRTQKRAFPTNLILYNETN